MVIRPIPGTEDNTKGRCKNPSITFAEGKLHFESFTTGAVYHYTLTSNDVASNAYSQTGDVPLSAAYNILAYATADDYSPSDVVNATLYWIGDNGEATGIINAKQRGVLASAKDGVITISGLKSDEKVSFYTVDGKLLGQTTAVNGTASYAVGTSGVVIVKLGETSIKVAL